ncbi:Ldh family oxidoreductase [Salinisphaera hydrothermalis]|uniref:Malate dehydrogenase n=1 Tax=Salinisphaera hydrothermalis (strain C41B8) TaxID=1304275 RepID=A0A084IPN1_SALHC|nr:Ldh family oxidoreductase [Salinisphaera hydrothermalis]KEZ78665.1 malate dehydrogenase [Salinisphaera hydrothermalis C41B8]
MSLVTAQKARELASAVLCNNAVSQSNANAVARALVAAELDGLASHGLSRLLAYADQAMAGKVDGYAKPRIRLDAPAALSVDAGHGFAFPAIGFGIEHGMARAREAGSCTVAIGHSHHAGVLGHHVEAAAENGFVALGFSNSPAAMAPWGGSKGVFGTNPIACAVPRSGAPPMVIDLSLSGVARGKVMLANQRGESIPEGWALDEAGKPTTEAAAALGGTMVPAGGAKGAALALMVEILSATLTGSSYAFEASSFFNADGPPPNIGQCFWLIDPSRLAGAEFAARLEVLFAAIANQSGARLPGVRRHELRAANEQKGVEIADSLIAEIRRRAGLHE